MSARPPEAPEPSMANGLTVTASDRPVLAYRGWSVLAGGFICAVLAVGGSIYIFGLFVHPVIDHYGLSRANANNGLIFFLLGMAVWSPAIGRILDRVSAQWVMSAGALLYAGGFVLVGTSSSLVVTALAIFGPIAIGVSSAGAMAANTVTARWFRRRRGRAIGLVSVATSAGGFVMAPIVARLVESLGWRGALVATGGGVSALILLAVLLLVRDRPEAHHLVGFDEFEGDQAGLDEEPETDGEQWGFGTLGRNRNFWFLTLGAGLLLASDQAIIASVVPYLVDAGTPLPAAATFVSCMSLSAILGKLLVGYLADSIDIRRLFGAVVACHLALLAAFIAQPGYWPLLAIVSTMGVAVGGVYPVWLSLTAAVFGSRSYGTIMGSMALVMQPISILAIRFVGEVHDRTGSYDWAFGTFLGFAVTAYFLVASISVAKDEAHG